MEKLAIDTIVTSLQQWNNIFKWLYIFTCFAYWHVITPGECQRTCTVAAAYFGKAGVMGVAVWLCLTYGSTVKGTDTFYWVLNSFPDNLLDVQAVQYILLWEGVTIKTWKVNVVQGLQVNSSAYQTIHVWLPCASASLCCDYTFWDIPRLRVSSLVVRKWVLKQFYTLWVSIITSMKHEYMGWRSV